MIKGTTSMVNRSRCILQLNTRINKLNIENPYAYKKNSRFSSSYLTSPNNQAEPLSIPNARTNSHSSHHTLS